MIVFTTPHGKCLLTHETDEKIYLMFVPKRNGLNQIKAFLSYNKKYRDMLSRVNVVALWSTGTQILKALSSSILNVAS